MTQADENAATFRRWPIVVLACLALIGSFLPFLGLGMALLALVLALRSPTGTGRKTLISLSVFALLLGVGFTSAYLACTPAETTGAEQDDWDAFERSFAPGGAGVPSSP